MGDRVFSSTVIPTVNRPTLARAVESVLGQALTGADFEVIVVNDSGTPLDEAEWQRSPRVRVIDVPGRERSVCRNTGAAVAKGQYLHFLDDDDVLLPGALERFRELDERKPAGTCWLFGGYETVDSDGRVTQEIRPALTGNIFAVLVAGESIPFQGSLLDNRCFFRAGGFDPVPAVLGVEDRDVGRRIALHGGVAGTSALVARIRVGERGSTTDWTRIAEGDRVGREKALCLPGARARLATVGSNYWRGRLARAYVASAAWNLKRGEIVTGVSRTASAAAITTWRALLPAFWRGLLTRVR